MQSSHEFRRDTDGINEKTEHDRIARSRERAKANLNEPSKQELYEERKTNKRMRQGAEQTSKEARKRQTVVDIEPSKQNEQSEQHRTNNQRELRLKRGEAKQKNKIC